jgi:hypothetical protein
MYRQLAGESACPTWTNVGWALSPANSGVFKIVDVVVALPRGRGSVTDAKIGESWDVV